MRETLKAAAKQNLCESQLYHFFFMKKWNIFIFLIGFYIFRCSDLVVSGIWGRQNQSLFPSLSVVATLFFLTTDQVTMWSAFIEFFLQRNFPCYSIQRCSAIFPSLPPALPNKWQLLSVLNSWYESYYLQDNFFFLPYYRNQLMPWSMNFDDLPH